MEELPSQHTLTDSYYRAIDVQCSAVSVVLRPVSDSQLNTIGTSQKHSR